MGAKSSGQIVKDPENQMGPDGLEPRAPIGMDADWSNPVKSRVGCR